MQKLFNFFGKSKSELSPEERKNRAIVTFIGYGLLFLIIVIMGYFVNDQDLKTQALNSQTSSLLNEKFENLKKNNYNVNMVLMADTDVLILNIERESLTKELIERKYIDDINYYYYDNNNYYEVNAVHTAYNKIDTINVYNDFDQTFLNIDNIVKFIEDEDFVIIHEEDYTIARYKIDDTKLLSIYNEINNTQIENEDSFEIKIDIQYNTDIEKIVLDLTDFFNLNSSYSYDIVSYNMSFDKVGYVEIKNINIE